MIHVLPQDIDKHWDRVKSGLERIIRRTGPTWRPEHVYVALTREPTPDAYLALIEDDAWLIWQRYPGDDRRGMLFVWACEGAGYWKHKDKVHKELEDMARKVQAKTIRLIGRKGWGFDPFWRHVGYVYEHEVPQ